MQDLCQRERLDLLHEVCAPCFQSLGSVRSVSQRLQEVKIIDTFSVPCCEDSRPHGYSCLTKPADVALMAKPSVHGAVQLAQRRFILASRDVTAHWSGRKKWWVDQPNKKNHMLSSGFWPFPCHGFWRFTHLL